MSKHFITILFIFIQHFLTMVDRTCQKCNKVFDLPCRLKLHQSRKTSCLLITLNENINNKQFKCKHCFRIFTTNSAMYRHIQKNCKMVNNPNKDSLILNVVQKQVEIQNEQIQKLSETIEKLKKEPIAHIQNIKTAYMQNIETQNITINILPFPKLNIKNEDILNPFLKENSAAAYEYAKIPYFALVQVNVAKSDANNQLLSSVALVHEMVENVYSNPDNRNVYFLKIA